MRLPFHDYLRAFVPLLLLGYLPPLIAQTSIPNVTTAAKQTIAGQVTSPEGKPVAEALVRLRLGELELRASTDADGSFSFDRLGNGTYTVVAENHESHSVPASVVLSSGRRITHLTLTLPEHAAPQAGDFTFSDTPDFVVSGVTDWTAAGGHGSDAMLRASEDLTRATTELRSTEKQVVDSNSLGAPERRAGELAEQHGDALAAVRHMQRATQIEGSESNYFAWASELLAHRALNQAAEIFQRGLVTYPRSLPLQTGLGTALFASGHYEQAAEHLCRASELQPTDRATYLLLGQVEEASPLALPCVQHRLEYFVQHDDQSADANYFYAKVLLHQNPLENLATAKGMLQRSVDLRPGYAVALLQLGILAAQERDYRGAIQSFQQAIASDPMSAETHYRLAAMYEHTGQHAAAQKEQAASATIRQHDAERIEQERRSIKQFVITPQ